MRLRGGERLPLYQQGQNSHHYQQKTPVKAGKKQQRNEPAKPQAVERIKNNNRKETSNMKSTLTTYEIQDALLQDDNAAWSYNGAKALAEWLDNLDDECGTETEFDRVAIRCEFSEYDSALDAATQQGGFEPDEDSDDDENEAAALEWLQDRTLVIEFEANPGDIESLRSTGTIIMQDF